MPVYSMVITQVHYEQEVTEETEKKGSVTSVSSCSETSNRWEIRGKNFQPLEKSRTNLPMMRNHFTSAKPCFAITSFGV